MNDNWNPRYLAYCNAYGHTPQTQVAIDRASWPGGCMAGFILWNRSKIVSFSRVRPRAFFMGQLSDHKAYDNWLLSEHPPIPGVTDGQG
ncbi:MAG: hypothetical protein ACK5XN_30160 [Bacteroidota bacterium]